MELNPENLLPPRKGRLLVSKPFLNDPYFQRTVVLLCDHNTDGTFGFVLNKYVDLDLSDIKLNIPGVGDKLALGGPVENKNVYYLHCYGEQMPGSLHIFDNIYMGGVFKDLKSVMAKPDFDANKVRFFVGYSGWTGDQLDEEINTESWYVASAKSKLIMDTNQDDLWGTALKTMGGDYANLANFPKDPKLN